MSTEEEGSFISYEHDDSTYYFCSDHCLEKFKESPLKYGAGEKKERCKLALKEQSAAYEAEAALEQIEEARLSLITSTRKTWWDIYYLQKSLEIIDSN